MSPPVQTPFQAPFQTETGQPIILTTAIARSGEGTVWQTDQTNILAKIYHQDSPTQLEKLRVMVTYPPQSVMAELTTELATDASGEANHYPLAWPQAVLLDSRGRGVGFLMPEVKAGRELLEIYSPTLRKRHRLPIHWQFLHTTALNLALVVAAMHRNGYVIGDLKPQNILVNAQALVALIDTDSFQVRHPHTGQVYPCLVATEGFTPPELWGVDLGQQVQTEFQDRFRLGLILYFLLYGHPPFQGVWVGSEPRPHPSEWLRQGWWPYHPKQVVRAAPTTVPLEVAHPSLQQGFLRCFNQGLNHPGDRPSAQWWVQALTEALGDLAVCSQSPTHFYSQAYGHCYWCDRAKTVGIDIFPHWSNASLPSVTTPVQERSLPSSRGVPTNPKPKSAILALLSLTLQRIVQNLRGLQQLSWGGIVIGVVGGGLIGEISAAETGAVLGALVGALLGQRWHPASQTKPHNPEKSQQLR